MRLRHALPALALLAVCSCGKTVPRYGHRTAPEWVDRLWSPAADQVSEAAAALEALQKTEPDAVLRAMEARLNQAPPAPDGTPMTFIVDAEAGQRLGLSAAARSDAVQGALPVLRSRLAGYGLVPASLKANLREELDVAVPGNRTRPEIERLQALLATRGALDLRLLVPDPELKSAEVARFLQAAAKHEPYVPAGPRWRVVPHAGVPAPTASDFEVVEEPTDPKDAIDERLIGSVSGGATKSGIPTLTFEPRPDRVEDLQRFLGSGAGRELGVILDGALLASAPVPAFDLKGLTIPVGPAAPAVEASAVEASAVWGRDLAVIAASGRFPWPIKPVSVGPRFSPEPKPDLPIARLLASFGAPALPYLRRVVEGSGPAWGKASAQWAIDHMAP